MQIGIIKEGKIPPDNRTPLSPKQCMKLKELYPQLDIKIEHCTYRCFTDDDYRDFGIDVVESVADSDVLLGIKEVPIDKLIAGKTYFFFSHTVKKQEYNRGLLQAIMQKNITLIDYEMLVDENEHRLIGFGRWAGIVGAHYALLMLGKRRKIYNLKPAVQCINKQEMLDQYHNLQIPPVKLVITGGGRVAQGAIEVMEHAEIHRVTKEEYLNETFDKPVFVQLHSKDLYHLPHKKTVDKHHFYHHPQEYENSFMPYIPHTDVLINCMFWSPLAPRLFEVADIENPDFNTKIIADISCDIDGSVPITFKATSIADPIYGVNIHDKRMGIPYQKNTIDVMAVGNLPNELPRDASKDFGKILMETFIPILLNGDKSTLLDRATITKNGKLTERYAYLEEFAEGG